MKRAHVHPVDQFGARGVRKPRVVSRHDPKRPGSPKGGAGDIIVVVALTWPVVRSTHAFLHHVKLGCEIVHTLFADGTMRTGQ